MRFRFRWLAGITAVSLVACSFTKVDKGYYAPEQPKYAIEMSGGKKHGRETWWHANGKLKYQAWNRKGLRDGKFTAWYSTGVKFYEGFERLGKPESTLTYWHANGRMQSRALFRNGIQLEREDWDESGRSVAQRGQGIGFPKDPDQVAKEKAASDRENDRLREAGLRLWAMRVRQTVESYWRLPKTLSGKPLRSVAKIKVGRNGEILAVTWSQQSASAPFNALAKETFKKIKRLPPFPPQVQEETLEVQYEFVSQGKAAPRRKLEAREIPDGDGP